MDEPHPAPPLIIKGELRRRVYHRIEFVLQYEVGSHGGGQHPDLPRQVGAQDVGVGHSQRPRRDRARFVSNGG